MRITPANVVLALLIAGLIALIVVSVVNATSTDDEPQGVTSSSTTSTSTYIEAEATSTSVDWASAGQRRRRQQQADDAGVDVVDVVDLMDDPACSKLAKGRRWKCALDLASDRV